MLLQKDDLPTLLLCSLNGLLHWLLYRLFHELLGLLRGDLFFDADFL